MSKRRLFAVIGSICLIFIMILIYRPVQGGGSQKPQLQNAGRLQIAFVSNRDNGNEEIYVVPVDGSREATNLTRDPVSVDIHPQWSPDGRLIVYSGTGTSADSATAKQDIFIMNQSGGAKTNLTNTPDINELEPAWSPDGGFIIYVAEVDGKYDLYVINNYGGTPRALTTDGVGKGEPAWSSDGTMIAYWALRNELAQIHICYYDSTKECSVANNNVIPLTNNGENMWPRWSKDNVIVFQSKRDNNYEVRTMNANGNGQGSVGGVEAADGRPTWSPDGTQIAFTSNRDIDENAENRNDNDEIYIMNADGSNLIRRSGSPYADHSPSWQPMIPTIPIPPTPTPNPSNTSQQNVAVISAAGGNLGNPDPRPLADLIVKMGIQNWHNERWTGRNIKIGVLDRGFQKLAELESTLGLSIVTFPGTTTADYDTLTFTPHGSQVIEIIHATAPDADFFVCSYNTFAEFTRCVDWMLSDQIKVQIINHSVGVPALPLDGNNPWAIKATEAAQRDVLWVNAAGNFYDGFVIDNYSDTNQNGYYELDGSEFSEEFVFPADSNNPNAAYVGPIIISWSSSTSNPAEYYDFNLEIHQNGAQVDVANQSHGRPTPAEALEYWPSPSSRLRSLTGEFSVKIFLSPNTPIPPGETVTIAMFAAFATIQNTLGDTVIAPGDATSVITVGALQRDNVAPYSSRDLIEARFVKPDLLAEGEVQLEVLDEYGPFIGTSAAAPFVAGTAALILESESLSLSELSNRLRNDMTINPPGVEGIGPAYGWGILQLEEPPKARNQEEGTIDETNPDIPRSVFFIPEAQAPIVGCPGGLEPRLEIGSTAFVLEMPGQDILNVREGVSTQSQVILQLTRESEPFVVIGGPECAGGTNRWQIQFSDGSSGWISEGNTYYYVSPLSLDDATLAPPSNPQCPNAPPLRMAIGDTVVVNEDANGNNPLRLRLTTQPDGGLNYTDNVEIAETGARLYILGGPTCSASRIEWRWYARNLETTREGWVSEGTPGEPWLCPESNPTC